MKPAIRLIVRSRTGAATALAEVGRQRAADLGLAVELVALPADGASAANARSENVTALVPVDFAAAQHEAWCLLCQLSLLRAEVGFSILVLGAESDFAFQARQHAVLVAATEPRPSRRRRSRAA